MTQELHRERMLTFVGVLAAIFLAALDQTIVGTAMPRVIADLRGFDRYTWVATIYMLTSTAVVPVVGKLSEQLGRKLIFMGGIVLFLFGSALTGASPDMNLLIVFRGLQGIGAGILTGTAFAIIADLFSPRERGKYTGLITGMWGLASVVGPLVGGFLTDNWGWRWVFYVNLPIGVVVLLGLWRFFPHSVRRSGQRIDYVGAAGLASGAALLVLGASLAGTDGWSSLMTLVPLVAGAVILAASLWYESRVEEAVLPPSLFANRTYGLISAVAFMMSIGMFGAVIFVPLFLQGVAGVSATNSGTTLTPLMVALLVGSVLSGLLVTRTGRYKVLQMFSGLGMLGGMGLLAGLTVNSGQAEVVRDMIVLGLGLGVGMAAFNVVAQNAVPRQMVSSATSALQFVRQMGGVLGLAVIGALVNQRFGHLLGIAVPKPALAALPRPAAAALSDPQTLLSGQAADPLGHLPHTPALLHAVQQVVGGVKLALAESIAEAFLIAAAVSCLVVVLLLFVPERPLSHVSAFAAVRAAAAEGEGGEFDDAPAGEVA